MPARHRARASGESTAEAIRQVAIDLFFKQSYRATSLRQIASRVGIQVGSLYNHISSKGELLFRIMERVMQDLLAEQRAVARAEDVVERLRALIYHHVTFHGERGKEVFLGNTELRSLGRQHHARIVALRNEYERLFQQTLQEGIRQGKFQPLDVKVVSYGLIAMLTWVASWYAPRGRLTLDQIGRIYADFALRGLWNARAGSLARHLGEVRALSR